MSTLGNFLLLGSWLLPLVLSAVALSPGLRKLLPAMGVVAPLPALALAILGSPAVLDLPWLVLGTRLGLDPTGRIFLVLAAVVWLAAALFGWRAAEIGQRRAGYDVAFLMAMSGSLLLPLAQDAITFYVAFSLMGLSSYWLVAHFRTAATDRAARWYLVLTLVGEFALFVGVLLAVIAIGPVMPAFSGDSAPLIALAFAAFGLAIKTGLVPFHLWLPLAHPAAPVAASAVLSGVMVKAGILGALRFLPNNGAVAAVAVDPVLWFGAATAIYGALVGLMQTGTKAALAYSTVSQMGLLCLAFGLLLRSPGEAATLAILLFVLHHGFAKAALFLGLGIRASAENASVLLVCLALPAAALAGLPFTSGAAAKGALKLLAGDGWAIQFVSASSILTTLLMLRILWLHRRDITRPGRSPSHPTALVAWLGVTLCVLAWPMVWPEAGDAVAYSLTPKAAFSAVWPVTLGLVAAALALWFLRTRALSIPQVPPGDIAAFVRLPRVRTADEAPAKPSEDAPFFAFDRLRDFESRLAQWSIVTLAGTVLAAALGAALL
ncbi:proton-conducting transporter membrane subunit [Erythrobacter sp.]|uniref:proton-conducting transporter transmembrane domain-containing protein n=1 Tax=Erythrobacter sp. TaxID=1042 RepID=UPI001B0E65C7|nr:proton-conducting transporter membrane subunit [Erythrobacter sp.]MBO6528296.1 hypothetical protein [Erythrobacter sp.]MBO6531358.1 hypothetical protein [Erythrobacter sp.]